MLHVKSILWPSDDSDSSVLALETAVALAKQFGARIYGLQVVPRVPVYTDTAVPIRVSTFHNTRNNSKHQPRRR